LGRLAEAEEAQREALELLVRSRGPEHLEVAVVLHSLAAVLADRGSFDEAGALMERALNLRRRHLGEQSALVAESRERLEDLRERSR